MSLSLESKIEAILFYKTDALSVAKLASILKSDKSKVEEALDSLGSKLSERGIVLVKKGDEVMLATSPEASTFIEAISKEELEGDLSKASLETLSIILYRDGITKSEIDHIRGVNAGYILRSLEIRGLIERGERAENRSIIYKPTMDLYRYLGIKTKEDLPEFKNFILEFEKISATKEGEEAIPPESLT